MRITRVEGGILLLVPGRGPFRHAVRYGSYQDGMRLAIVSGEKPCRIESMTSVRPAQLSDSEALFPLAKAFATSFAVERSAFEPSLAALLQSPDAFIAVASDAERVGGYVLGFDHHTFFANGRVSWVEEIMVSEDCRRRGIGRLLMDRFEQWARDRQSKLIALATRHAAPFYRSMGYNESATYFRKSL